MPFFLAGASCLIGGIAVILTGLKMRKGMGVSEFVGVRTKHTKASDRAFSKANQSVWKSTCVNGGLMLIMALAFVYAGFDQDVSPHHVVTVVLALTGVLIIITIMQVIKANRIAKAINAEDAHQPGSR